MTQDQKLDLILSSVQTLGQRFDGLEEKFEREMKDLRREIHDLTETVGFIKNHGVSKEDLHATEQRLGRRLDGLDFRVGNIESTLFRFQPLTSAVQTA